ncbi:hypothetical protein [Kribbella deserti]|uniref:Uncharacterized protein n=1 Tax=Kribbella deserti TaxID=1926257 RepID=A0ABV6QMS9_9ACTN
MKTDTRLAAEIVRSYDPRITPERYPSTAAHGPWPAEVTTHADHHALTVLFEVSTRLAGPDLQVRARERMAEVLAASGDANSIVITFDRRRAHEVLDAGLVPSEPQPLMS